MNRSEIKQALAGCEFFESLEEGDIEKIISLCWHREL